MKTANAFAFLAGFVMRSPATPPADTLSLERHRDGQRFDFDIEADTDHAPGACLSDRCPSHVCIAVRANMRARHVS